MRRRSPLLALLLLLGVAAPGTSACRAVEPAPAPGGGGDEGGAGDDAPGDDATGEPGDALADDAAGEAASSCPSGTPSDPDAAPAGCEACTVDAPRCACRAEFDACAADADCHAILDCVLAGEGSLGLCGLSDPSQVACVRECIDAHPAGEAAYLATERCSSCGYCVGRCHDTGYCDALFPSGWGDDAGADATAGGDAADEGDGGDPD